MFKLLYQSIVTAILASDTSTALSLLQDNHSALLDPLEGQIFHAEVLYYAIKKANLDLIRYLFNLCIGSDLSFYNYCGHTPLSLIISQGLNDIIPEAISKTDKNFALMMAVKLQDKQLVNLLLNKCTFKDRFLRFLGIAK